MLIVSNSVNRYIVDPLFYIMFEYYKYVCVFYALVRFPLPSRPLLLVRYKTVLCFAAALSSLPLPISTGRASSSASMQQVAVAGLFLPSTPTNQLPVIPTVSNAASLEDFTALNFSLVLPVPTQLINKIESSNFVDMSKLLGDHMGVLDNEDHPKSTKPKCRNVTNIVE